MKMPGRFVSLLTTALTFMASTALVRANIDTWTGGGTSNVWNQAANWSGGVPQTGDDLIFTNTIGLGNTNNLAGRSFNSITFATPSGAFSLFGNQIGINTLTDNQAYTAETIGLPLVMGSGLGVSVVANGALNVNGVISGSGNITKTGGG